MACDQGKLTVVSARHSPGDASSVCPIQDERENMMMENESAFEVLVEDEYAVSQTCKIPTAA